jgi:hypothetical protein
MLNAMTDLTLNEIAEKAASLIRALPDSTFAMSEGYRGLRSLDATKAVFLSEPEVKIEVIRQAFWLYRAQYVDTTQHISPSSPAYQKLLGGVVYPSALLVARQLLSKPLPFSVSQLAWLVNIVADQSNITYSQSEHILRLLDVIGELPDSGRADSELQNALTRLLKAYDPFSNALKFG